MRGLNIDIASDSLAPLLVGEGFGVEACVEQDVERCAGLGVNDIDRVDLG